MNHVDEFFMLAKLNLLFAVGQVTEISQELKNRAGKVDPVAFEIYNAFIQMISTCEKVMDFLESPALKFDQQAAEQFANNHTIFETVAAFLGSIYRHREWLTNVLSIRDILALAEVFRYALAIEMGPTFPGKKGQLKHSD